MNKKLFISMLLVLLVVFSAMPLAMAGETTKEAKNVVIKKNAKNIKFLEKVKLAKDNLKVVKEAYNVEKKERAQLREDLRNCEGEECEANKLAMKQKSKEFLLRLVELAEKHIEKIKLRIEDADLEEDRKSEILNDLEEDLVSLDEAKKVLESEEITKEELKEATKTIRDIWRKAKPKLKFAVHNVIHAKLGNLAAKLDHLRERFGNIADGLSEEGIDVTNLEASLEEFDSLNAEAKDYHDKARELFAQAHEGELDKEVLDEAKDYQKRSREKVKEIKELIKEIVKMIKEVKEGAL